ncbi:hypothetical protein [Slackia heliotrinireducens]|uniref:hypothetical protein n=1 Tax=Slackia heliotrinireducens TaxID=84110 RepID=UPI003315052A
MELADLHEVTWGEGYELYYVGDEATDPVYVGHFGYDDAKPTSYMRCTVVGVACVENKLEVTVRNPIIGQMQESAEEPIIDIR